MTFIQFLVLAGVAMAQSSEDESGVAGSSWKGCPTGAPPGVFRACLRYESGASWVGMSRALITSGEVLEVLLDAPAWVEPNVSARYRVERTERADVRDMVPGSTPGIGAEEALKFQERRCQGERCLTSVQFPGVGGEDVRVDATWTLRSVPVSADEWALLNELSADTELTLGMKRLLAVVTPVAERPVLPAPLGTTVPAKLAEVGTACAGGGSKSCEQAILGAAVEFEGLLGTRLGGEDAQTATLLVDTTDWFGAMRLGVAMPVCVPLRDADSWCADGLGRTYSTEVNAAGESEIVSRSVGYMQPSLIVSYTHVLCKGPKRRLHLGLTGGLGLAEGQDLSSVELGLRSVQFGLDIGTLNLSVGPALVAYRRETLPAGLQEGGVVADPALFKPEDTWTFSGGLVLHVPIELYRFGTSNDESTGIGRLLDDGSN